jgi:hypothetical protein
MRRNNAGISATGLIPPTENLHRSEPIEAARSKTVFNLLQGGFATVLGRQGLQEKTELVLLTGALFLVLPGD